MIYLIFLALSCTYLYTLNKYANTSYSKFVVYIIPLILFWCLLIGGQYNVGTDYFSYMAMFRKGGDISYVSENRGEIVFSGVVNCLKYFGITGQGIFIVISLIEILLLSYIMYDCVGSKYAYLFLFVFIVFPGILHNQMNGIRQYIVVYLITMSVCCLLHKQYIKTLILFIISPLIHQSAIFVIPLILLIYKFAYVFNKKKWLYLIVVISLILSFVITPEHSGVIFELSETYEHYTNSELMAQHTLLQKLPKYIYLPLILLTIHKSTFIQQICNNKLNYRLFLIGIVGYSLKLATISVGLLSRIGQYFDIISCIPIIWLLIYLKPHKKVYMYIIMIYLLLPYAAKVLISTEGEYSYNFFLLH